MSIDRSPLLSLVVRTSTNPCSSDGKYTFSQATFDGTNLSQYEVAVVRYKPSLYILHLTRRCHVKAQHMNPQYDTTQFFSATTEADIITIIQNFNDPTQYRTWSDGTLVIIDEWMQQQAQSVCERALLGM